MVRKSLLGALAMFLACGTAAAALSSGESRFLRDAAASGHAEVALAQLAQQKALREEVKQFAARMLEDHRKANASLTELAGAKQVDLPAAPPEDHRKHRERLDKLVGPEFDRAYMKMMVEDHEKAVKNFERQAKSAKDSDVRDFAARNLPTLKGHLAAARGTYDLSARRHGERETGSKR